MKIIALFLLPMILACGFAVTAAHSSPDSHDWTCPMPTAPAMSAIAAAVPDRSVLISARQSVIEYALSLDTYVMCLNSAFHALKEAHIRSGGSVDPAVENLVTASIGDVSRYKGWAVGVYNASVARYNASLTQDGSLAIKSLIVSLDTPPSDARISLPAGDSLLTMPGLLTHRPQGMCHYHPNANGPLLENDKVYAVLVGFDISLAGALENIHIARTSGVKELDDAGLGCVSTWSGLPGLRNGVPVASPNHETVISFVFHS